LHMQQHMNMVRAFAIANAQQPPQQPPQQGAPQPAAQKVGSNASGTD
jgi:hypothetical protein